MTDKQLKQLIKEEVDTLEEGWLDRLRARTSGVGGLGGALGKRAKAIGKLATTTKDEPIEDVGDIAGAYAKGKANKLSQLHARKLNKAGDKFIQTLQGVLKDLHNDMGKLGISMEDSTKIFAPMVQDSINKLVRNVSPLGQLDSDATPGPAPPAAGGGVDWEEQEKKYGPPPGYNPSAPEAAPEEEAAAESEDEEKERFKRFAAQAGNLEEHFKRFL